MRIFFCTVEQVAVFLPDLEIGSSSDATSEAIELDISDKYSELLEIIERNGYQINSPTAHQKDVLALLNQLFRLFRNSRGGHKI